MRPLKVNFAIKRRLPAWPLYLLAVVLAGAAAWKAISLVDLYAELRQREAAVQSAKRQLEQELARKQAASAQPVAPYMEDALAVVRQSKFPLDAVFASLENTQVPGVRLVSLDISPPAGIAKVELEYGDQESLFQYVDAINAGEPEHRWSLTQVRSLQSGTGGNATIVLTS